MGPQHLSITESVLAFLEITIELRIEAHQLTVVGIILIPILILIQMATLDLVQLLDRFMRRSVLHNQLTRIDLLGCVGDTLDQHVHIRFQFDDHLVLPLLSQLLSIFQLLHQFHKLSLNIIQHNDIVILQRVSFEFPQQRMHCLNIDLSQLEAFLTILGIHMRLKEFGKLLQRLRIL